MVVTTPIRKKLKHIPAKKKPFMVSGLIKVSLPQCTTSKISVTRRTYPKRRAKPKKRTM